MDVRALREGREISLRELQRKTGISLGTLSRIETGEREASAGDAVLIEAALEAVPVPEAEVIPLHTAKPGRRRAYRCSKCNYRRFLHPNDPAKGVECPQHGPMPRQVNRPYLGQSTG